MTSCTECRQHRDGLECEPREKGNEGWLELSKEDEIRWF